MTERTNSPLKTTTISDVYDILMIALVLLALLHVFTFYTAPSFFYLHRLTPYFVGPRRQGEATVWTGLTASRTWEMQHGFIKVFINRFIRKNYLNSLLKFRLQKEKDDTCADIDRSRDKYEKLQVSKIYFWIKYSDHINYS